jgi:Domain of unknown function (DUF4336)
MWRTASVFFILYIHFTAAFIVEHVSIRGASSSRRGVTKTKREIGPPEFDRRRVWNLNDFAFSLLPISPKDQRATICQEVVKGKIWTLDQIQGLLLINVPVRSTVVKLQDGGLLVYNPIAPTQEALDMISQLEAKHGKVKYIVLGTIGRVHHYYILS